MAEIDPVVLKLIAENREYIAGVNRAGKTTSTVMTRNQREVARLERQFKTSSSAIANQAKFLASSFAAAFSVRELTGLIDGYTRLQNQLRVSGLEGEELAKVQQKLREIGSEYGVELEALTNVFNRAALAQDELGASTSQIIRLNEVIGASLKVTGTSAEQARGAFSQQPLHVLFQKADQG